MRHHQSYLSNIILQYDYHINISYDNIEDEILHKDSIGLKYFEKDLSITEIIEEFNQIHLSKHSGGLHLVNLLNFVFIKALYTKLINKEEAKNIYSKYFCKEYSIEDSEFIQKILCYSEHEEDNELWKNFIEYLKELNYIF